MDSATPIDIPLPSEFPGLEDPSPATRDPLNSMICALLDPFRTIEEIAEDRKITVMRLSEILSAEPASSTLDSLRTVFALRADLLAQHAQVSAVGTLIRIANSGKDDEVARRAATTLLRMFRPDGSRAPDRDRAPNDPRSSPAEPRPTPRAHTPAMRTSLRGCAASSEIAGSVHPTPSSLDDPTSPSRERGPLTPEPTLAPTNTAPSSSPRATPTLPTAPSERGGPELRQQPLRTAINNHPPQPTSPQSREASPPSLGVGQHIVHPRSLTPASTSLHHQRLHARPPPCAAP